jgi:hypothetical protein
MRWFVGWLMIAGCYSPNPKEGTPCSVSSECPAPLVCESNVCGRGGHGSSDAPDAAISDSQTGTDSSNGNDAALSFVPSNGIDPTTALGLTLPIEIDGTATFNVDTGRINGALSRSQGIGVNSGIGYHQVMSGATPLAVFSFHSLDVDPSATIKFNGSRAVVFVVARDAEIEGEIDLGGCTAGACPGPGGGNGTLYTSTGGGCGGGAGGVTNASNAGDSGGGGGAGGGDGAKGGDDDEYSTVLAGGAGGIACIPETIEPLIGGSGGAGGGPGVITGPRGGSGGGALQLTAFGSITISGVIDAGGGGGGGGGADPNGNNAGAGAGGGAGGAILLEAPSVTLTTSGILAANGGGGGAGGGGTTAGPPGQRGTRSTTPAAGGQRGNSSGGAGGAGETAAAPGGNVVDNNAGGGGGGVGRIRIRASSPTIDGTLSPAPSTASL